MIDVRNVYGFHVALMWKRCRLFRNLYPVSPSLLQGTREV